MKKKTFIVLGVIIAFLVLGYINLAIYPFSTTRPNFSDVERVFNKMRFPSDWQQIDESENRGIAGRQCPIESESTCYHKSKKYKTPQTQEVEPIKIIMQQTGCPEVSVSDNREVDDPTPSVDFGLVCSSKGLTIRGSFTRDLSTNDVEVSIIVSTL